WLQLSIILGGVAVAIRMPSPLARIGALFSALWTFLLLVWIGANLGVVAAPPLSPLYFYLMMYPFWALLSLYALVTLFEIVTARGAVLIRSSAHLWIPAAICLTALAFVALFRASPNVFNSPQDAQDLNFALPRLPNIAIFPAIPL